MSDSQPRTWVNALIGAVVTAVFSFTVVSPVVGGAVAGYLQRDDGVRVGALSGCIAVLPILLFGVLFLGLLAAGELPVAVGLLLLTVSVVIGFAYVVGLSALGGYLGVYLRAEFGN